MGAETKSRRLLTEADMLSIFESSEEEVHAADQELTRTAGKILDGTFDAGTFERLVKDGRYQASTIMVKGEPAFVLIHAKNALGWLLVEGAIHLGKASMGNLFEGGYALARHLKCPKIVFVTCLKGLYRYATGEHDFQSLGVILAKDVPQ